MTAGPPRRIAGLALIAALAIAAWFATPRLPILDDGYISLDSAQSALAGVDPQYGSPPLTGVTSPPYVLLLAVFLAAHMPPLVALRAALAVGLLALVVATWALGGSVGLTGWRRIALPAAVLAAGPVVQQATNGVETGWAMAVAILLIAAALARRPYWTGALAGLLPWLRPDLAPLAGLMFAFALWHEPSAVRARAVGIAALVFCPWPAWLAFQGGGWIPQTMKAKAAFFAENCLPLSTKMTMARERLDAWAAMFLPALLLAAAFLVRSALGWISILASAITLSAYTWMLPGGLSHNAYRYVYPIGVPLIALGIALALENRERIWRITFALVFVASMLLWARQPWNSLAEAADREAVGAWIREHADPHATILVHDAGGLAVFTPNPLVDLVGLKTPSSIAQHERFTAPSCGADRGRAVAAIARASGAEYFVVALDWDGYFKLTGDLQDAGFRLQLVRAQPPGVNGYRVYRLEPPLAIGK